MMCKKKTFGMFPVILSPYTNIHYLHQSIDAPRNVAFEDGVILVADSRGDFTLLQESR
jgi:hypothetical protein